MVYRALSSTCISRKMNPKLGIVTLIHSLGSGRKYKSKKKEQGTSVPGLT